MTALIWSGSADAADVFFLLAGVEVERAPGQPERLTDAEAAPQQHVIAGVAALVELVGQRWVTALTPAAVSLVALGLLAV
jgi:hypothetical protein